MWRAWFLLLCISAFASQADATGRVFYEDYESYANGAILPKSGVPPSTPVSIIPYNWDGFSGDPIIQILSTDGTFGPFAGTKMGRFNTINNTGSSRRLFITTAYTDEFLMRIHLRFDNNWVHPSGGSGSHMIRFFENGGAIGGVKPDWLFPEATTGQFAEDISLNGHLSFATSFTNISPWQGSWHTYERYCKLSTGVFKSWVDGVLRINSNMGAGWAGAQRWDTFDFISNNPAGSGYVYFDNFEIYSDLGSGGTGLMSNATITQGGGDITAPSVPTNLRVVSVVTNAVTLAWDASTDDTAVTGYLVEHCTGVSCAGFIQVGAPVSLTFNDSGILTNTSYSFRVRATDAASNLSSYSSTLTQATDTVKFELTFKFRRVVSEIREFFHSFFSPWMQMAANQGGLS